MAAGGGSGTGPADPEGKIEVFKPTPGHPRRFVRQAIECTSAENQLKIRIAQGMTGDKTAGAGLGEGLWETEGHCNSENGRGIGTGGEGELHEFR